MEESIMKVDLYTKSVLTIIAISLTIIALKISTPIANADQQKIQKVVICDPITDRCARVGTASKSGSEPVDALLTVSYND